MYEFNWCIINLLDMTHNCLRHLPNYTCVLLSANNFCNASYYKYMSLDADVIFYIC